MVMQSEKDNRLKFNQHIKSDKMTYIFYADLKSLVKKQMYIRIILKIIQHQKQINMFFADNKCQLYGHFIIHRTAKFIFR